MADAARSTPAPVAADIARVLVCAAAGVVAAPALIVGIVVAEWLRSRRRRWTWVLAPALAGVVALVAVAPAAARRVAHVAEQGSPPVSTLRELALALAPSWACLVPIVALGAKLYRDRKDRLHGGEQERAVRDAVGPIELLRVSRARAREEARGALAGDGVLLGVDHRGAPVRVPTLHAHATIVGASNSGKTNTASLLLDAQAAGGGGFVVLDGKGGRDLPCVAAALGAREGRRVALWSVQPFGEAALDALRLPWNVTGGGTPTEIKDRIAASEEQTEPYYRALASRGLLLAASVLAAAGPPLRLDDLADGLERPAGLHATLNRSPGREEDARWLASLSDRERSALRGMGTRLRTMVASDGGASLLPASDGCEIDLLRAVRENWLVVFSLPQGTYPELVPHVARYLLQALSGVCSRVEASGTRANAMVFVDELSALDGDQLCAGLERGRSAGVRFVVATQSLSNFASAGGDKLLHAALDNAELLVVHRQAVPDAVDLLAAIGGTEEAWDHTHVVSDAAGYRIAWDETGMRQRRRSDRFRAHPNAIRQLGQGEALLVAHRPAFSVRQVRVRRAVLDGAAQARLDT